MKFFYRFPKQYILGKYFRYYSADGVNWHKMAYKWRAYTKNGLEWAKKQKYVLGVKNVTQVSLMVISSCSSFLQGLIPTNFSQFSFFEEGPLKKPKKGQKRAKKG